MNIKDVIWPIENRDRTGLSLAVLMADFLLNSGKYSAESEAGMALSDLNDLISDACEESGVELLPQARALKLRGKPGAPLPTSLPLCPEAFAEEMELDQLYQAAVTAREVPYSKTANCPQCGVSFVKASATAVYCSNGGFRNCKDAFHNRVKGLKMTLASRKGLDPKSWNSNDVYVAPHLR